MKNKTILVTGIAGFIGYNLARKLINAGYSVIGIDNFDPYYNVALKRRRVKELLGLGVRVIEGNILIDNDLREVFKTKIDTVVHLAAKVGVRHSFEKPEDYMTTNVLGTIKMLEWSNRHTVEQFIFASSSSVYGDQSKLPFSEDDVGQGRLLSPYAASKRSAELYCEMNALTHGLATTVLRFFTVYGSNSRPDMAIYRITESLKKNQNFTIYGVGRAKRDFTHIDDVVSGILALLERKTLTYEIYNLGGDKATSLLDFIRMIEKRSIGSKESLQKKSDIFSLFMRRENKVF